MRKYNTKYIDDVNELNKDKRHLEQFLVEKDLEIENYLNAMILPCVQGQEDGVLFGKGGLVCNGKYIEKSAIYAAKNMKTRIYGMYDVDDYVYVDEEVIYLGYFKPHWGHFLVDFITRLWYILECPEDSRRLIYFVDKDCDISINDSFLRFFELLGIAPERLLIVKRSTLFKKVILPEVSQVAGEFTTNQYKNIIDSVQNNVVLNKKTYEKIYFARKNKGIFSRKEMGERRIIQLFRYNGFKIVYPEQLTLDEQIWYLMNCSYFVGTVGSLTHNLLFLKKETKVLLINKTYLINRNQLLINELREVALDYVDCHKSFFPVLYGLGPFLLVCNDNLKLYFRDNNLKWKNNSLLVEAQNKINIILYLIKYYINYSEIPNEDGKNPSLEEINKIYRFYR